MRSRPARHRYCRCGTHLAAENKERQCARCQRASRDKLIAPPQVPAEFWQSEQLREAFTAQHIGRVARAYRMHPHHHAAYGPSGISQTLLGHWLGLRQPQISRQEGACYLDLNMVAEACTALTRALDLLAQKAPHRVRDRVHYLVRLARCYLPQREVERACEIAAEAATLSETIGSARVVERLGEFHGALDPFTATKPARDFRELYADAVAQRSSMN